MRDCDKCNEPAIKQTLLVSNDGSVEKYHCYLHAIEENLIEGSLEDLKAVAQRVDYPVNAVAFVAEAIRRADEMKTAQDICLAVRDSAEDRFSSQCYQILHNWKIRTSEDIGRVAIGLMNGKVIPQLQNITQADFGSLNYLLDDSSGGKPFQFPVDL